MRTIAEHDLQLVFCQRCFLHREVCRELVRVVQSLLCDGIYLKRFPRLFTQPECRNLNSIGACIKENPRRGRLSINSDAQRCELAEENPRDYIGHLL